MKIITKILTVVTIIVLAQGTINSAKAQGIFYGIRGGGSMSDLTDRPNSKVLWGGNIGGFFGYQFNSIWGAQIEAVYSFQGYKAGVFAAQGVENGDKVTLNYIKVPMVVKMFLIGGLNFETGVSLNFRTTAMVNGGKLGGTNWFDVSIPVGLAYQFNRKLEVGVRQDFSTMPVDKGITGHNSVLSLNIAWKF